MLRIGVLSSRFSPQAFTGSGNRLDGKKKGIEPSPAPLDPSDIKRYQPQSDPDHFTLTAKLYVLIFAVFFNSHRGIPNYEFKVGKITFIRNARQQPRRFDIVSEITGQKIFRALIEFYRVQI